jgi:hypothetical protein
MGARRIGVVALFALLGVAVATGIGLLANAISRDSIGLAAEPLQAGRQLAPPQAAGGLPRPAPERAGERGGRSATQPTAATGEGDGGAIEPGDDRGGALEPSDDGDGGSGSSGSSGSGSSGSGSSGNSTSGSGSDSSGPGGGSLDD